MNILKWIVNLIKILNSNQAPGQVAGGVAFAFMLALIPANNLLWILLFVVTFFLKVHNGIESLFIIIFKTFIFVFDPILDSLGYLVLTLPSLQNFFTYFANLPLALYTNFNNSIVMGGLVLGLILWIPIYFIFVGLIKYYRNTLREKIMNSKIVKWFMNLPLVSAISQISGKASRIFSIHNQ